jgi:glycosyltransferase involved in cell wall biosynthesis
MIHLTIIIPVYNEVKTINTLLKKVLDLKIKKQVIIIDDFSTDGTRKVLLKYKNKVNKIIFHNSNLGKGAAIQTARKFIKGRYVVIQDADLEYNPKDLLKLLKKLKRFKLDVVYGSRVLKKNKYQNTKNFTHLIRIWGNVFLTKLSNIINRQSLTDAHTCYKMFNTKIFKNLKLKEKGFAFCPEVTTKISKKKYIIKEIPISYNGRSYTDGKKINSMDGIIAIYCLIKYRFTD